MTDQQLHNAIEANEDVLALVDAGNDAGAAEMLVASLPKVPVEGTYVTDRWIIASFPDPATGDAFLSGLALVAEQNPVIARVLKWLSPAEGGIDVGNQVVRAQLDYLASLGVPGINQEVVDTLKELAAQPQWVSADDVSRVWLQHRENGRIE